MATTSAQVQQLYVAYLGRAADKAGLDYWMAELNATPAVLTLENLRANFVNEQPEYANAYAGLTRSETVSKIYLQLFGRPADAAGLEYWTTGAGASVNADQLLVAFVSGASAADAKVVANKVLVSEVYTTTAGTNYTAADAKSIIADVKGVTKSVTDALVKLENGSLSGIAIPQGVALLKAEAIAKAAVESYETSKAASLVALNDKVVALKAGYTVTLDPVTDANTDGKISYDEAVNALTNATKLRDVIGGTKVSTAQLQLNAKEAADLLVTARADLVKVDGDAVAHINTYNAAVAANAKLTAPTQTAKDIAQGALDATFKALPTDLATANTAYKAAVTGAVDIKTAAELYAVIKGADAATLAKVDTAFSGLAHYSDVKTVAVADAAKVAAVAAQTAAEKVITDFGVDYVTKAQDSVAANKIVADAQTADTLVAQAAAETAAHKALADSAKEAGDAVTAADYAHDLDAAAPITAGDNAKADLFYFSAIKQADALTLTNFNKGDALYIGEGYTLNTAAKYGTDGFVTGSNVALKEVFFTQAANGEVSVNVETNAIGHVAGAGDNIATIVLSGVNSLADVSFSNGIILSNHVA